jgi:hypothetical protein
MRPKTVQNLIGQAEKARRFSHVGGTLGAAGVRGHERDADDTRGQVDDLWSVFSEDGRSGTTGRHSANGIMNRFPKNRQESGGSGACLCWPNVASDSFGNSVSVRLGGLCGRRRGGGGIAPDTASELIVPVDRDWAVAAHGGVMQNCLNMSKILEMSAGSLTQVSLVSAGTARMIGRAEKKVKKQSQP